MKTEILTISPLAIDESAIEKAADIIRGGGLVVFPTETVYGIGGDATNADAARAIYEAKGRPSDNPLIIHINIARDNYCIVFTDDCIPAVNKLRRIIAPTVSENVHRLRYCFRQMRVGNNV